MNRRGLTARAIENRGLPPLRQKNGGPEGTPMRLGILVENSMRQLSGIEQSRGRSGHFGDLSVLAKFLEALSFQWLARYALWHGKCYIPV